MKINSDIEYKILKDEHGIIKYEKGVYNAFMTRDPGGWTAKNYEIVDNCRLRSKTISYRDIIIVAAVENEKIIAASSVNYNMKNKLQLEEMGFHVKKEKDACEGLIFYTAEEIKGEKFLEISGKLFSFALDYGKKRGIKTVYGTCSRNLKAIYTLMGWEVVDRLEVEGVKKLLLRYSL